MNIKLLTKHHLEFLSLKGGCTDSPETKLVKMPHCWKITCYASFKFSIAVYLVCYQCEHLPGANSFSSISGTSSPFFSKSIRTWVENLAFTWGGNLDFLGFFGFLGFFIFFGVGGFSDSGSDSVAVIAALTTCLPFFCFLFLLFFGFWGTHGGGSWSWGSALSSSSTAISSRLATLISS